MCDIFKDRKWFDVALESIQQHSEGHGYVVETLIGSDLSSDGYEYALSVQIQEDLHYCFATAFLSDGHNVARQAIRQPYYGRHNSETIARGVIKLVPKLYRILMS